MPKRKQKESDGARKASTEKSDGDLIGKRARNRISVNDNEFSDIGDSYSKSRKITANRDRYMLRSQHSDKDDGFETYYSLRYKIDEGRRNTGAIGIFGFRDRGTLMNYKILPHSTDESRSGAYISDLRSIIETSDHIREVRDEYMRSEEGKKSPKLPLATVERFRNMVGVTNRRIDFTNPIEEVRRIQGNERFRREEHKQLAQAVNKNGKEEIGVDPTGIHTLHSAADIAAIFRGRRGERIYTYEHLIAKLERRFGDKSTREFKLYSSLSDTPCDRRKFMRHIADGLKQASYGRFADAHNEFNNAKLTDKGKKWIYKITSIMIAERARAYSNIKEDTELDSDNLLNRKIDDAINGIVTHGFKGVFLDHKDGLAMFSEKNGSRDFRSSSNESAVIGDVDEEGDDAESGRIEEETEEENEEEERKADEPVKRRGKDKQSHPWYAVKIPPASVGKKSKQRKRKER